MPYVRDYCAQPAKVTIVSLVMQGFVRVSTCVCVCACMKVSYVGAGTQ